MTLFTVLGLIFSGVVLSLMVIIYAIMRMSGEISRMEEERDWEHRQGRRRH